MGEFHSESGSGFIGGVGFVVAGFISWNINHSIFWTVVHAFCSWLYVLYWLGSCAGELPPDVPSRWLN